MGVITENVYAFGEVGSLQFAVKDPVTVASAVAMPAPKARITTVSGTAAISTIAIPWPGFTGSITYIPTGLFTGVTGGTADGTNFPIAVAFAAGVSRALILTFDGSSWFPNNFLATS